MLNYDIHDNENSGAFQHNLTDFNPFTLLVCLVHNSLYRYMMVRNTKIQNLFRVQRSSRSSFDFLLQTYNYVIALEPELKEALLKFGENSGKSTSSDEMVDVCVRAFSMMAVALKVRLVPPTHATCS